MAYSNTGTPRFYVDYLLWQRSLGLQTIFGLTQPLSFDEATLEKTLNLNPSNPVTLYSPDDAAGGYVELIAPPPIPSSTATNTRYFAILGHNLASAVTGTNTPLGLILSGTDVVNGSAQHNGFSIVKDLEELTNENDGSSEAPYGVYKIMLGAETSALKVGCYSVGNYYDMPHSPDLNLTMSREMDGVTRIRTRGGNDLVDHKYIKPAFWGNAGAWELYSGTPTNQKISRAGRRIWELSFTHLQDSDVFPMLSSLVPYESTSATDEVYSIAAATETIADDWWNDNTLLDSNNFYSQVIHKTNGGQLPFIFQPDNNYPEFAICKLDQSSIQFKQVANGVYNVKLKIREVW